MWMSKAISANELFLLSYKWIMGSHFSTAEYNSIGYILKHTSLHILSLIEILIVLCLIVGKGVWVATRMLWSGGLSLIVCCGVYEGSVMRGPLRDVKLVLLIWSFISIGYYSIGYQSQGYLIFQMCLILSIFAPFELIVFFHLVYA